VYDYERLQTEIKLIPCSLRQTFKGMQQERHTGDDNGELTYQMGVFRRYSSALKPVLHPHHEVARMMYAVNHVGPAIHV
jgi:hypothetical protein